MELIVKKQISWKYRAIELAIWPPCNCDNHVNGITNNNDNNEYDVVDISDKSNSFQLIITEHW